MRVGDVTAYRNTLTNILNNQREQYRVGKEGSTGNRVNAPSDDSAYASTILTSRYALVQVKQYRTNLETAQNWLVASENSMTSMVERLTRARTLAEQISNGTYTADQYPSVAAEIKSIINDLTLLTNANSNGTYIFGGTNSNVAPASKYLVAANPAVMNAPGHDTSASLYDTTGSGNYQLRLSRLSSGLYSTLQIAAGNTLGQSLGYNFGRDSWEVIRAASATSGQVIQNSNSFSSDTDPISGQAGESFSWLADTDTGWQTFRTWATITGSGSVEINNVTYTYNDAQDLMRQLNASGDKTFTAVLDDNGDVRVLSCGNPINITEITANTVNQTTTLEQFNSALEDGLTAQGVFSIDSSNSLTFPPNDSDYVRLGDIKVTWGEIKSAGVNSTNLFATSDDYAQGLQNYLQTQTSEFKFTLVPSDPPNSNVACLQIEAAVPGKKGNVVLESSSYATKTSGNLYGGLDPMGGSNQDPGRIYASGHSNLNISTTISGQVIGLREHTDGSIIGVTVALNWIDDNGVNQHVEVELRNAGESGKINIPELGPDFYLYRDNQTFELGATFEMKLNYLQSNREDINVNYSENNELRYNWNAWQVMGDNLRMDLRGVEAVPRNTNNSNGLVSLSGFYHGLYAQNLTFDIIESGELEDGMVLVRASWIDENGQAQQQTVAMDGSGTGGGAVLPIMGFPPKIDLTGVAAVKSSGTDTAFNGQIVMQGDYRGLTSCDFKFEITGGGTLNNDNANNTPVTVMVSWVDDQGIYHEDELEFNCAGEQFAMEIPGANGLSFYLEPGNYTDNSLGNDADVFMQKVIMSPEHAGEGFFFQLEPGSYQVGDSYFVSLEPSEQHVFDILQQWCLALESGDQEFAQTWSQRSLVILREAQERILDFVADSGARQNRITGRTAVLDSKELFNTETLVALQQVDEESNLLELQLVLSNYTDILTATSKLSNMFILNYI